MEVDLDVYFHLPYKRKEKRTKQRQTEDYVRPYLKGVLVYGENTN